MKLELDSKSIGRVNRGDVVTVREIKSYCGRDEHNGKYATIHRTSEQTFDTGSGAMDHHRGERKVKEIINDGEAVIV
jgi:hypothetical protein